MGLVAELYAGSDWRAVVSAVASRDDVFAFGSESDTSAGYPWPHKMRCEGPTSFATELIACVWAGPPLTAVARGPCAATDDQLAALRQRVGSLRRARFVRRALKVQSNADDVDLSFEEVVLRMRGARLDLAAMSCGCKPPVRSRNRGAPSPVPRVRLNSKEQMANGSDRLVEIVLVQPLDAPRRPLSLAVSSRLFQNVRTLRSWGPSSLRA